MSKVIQGWKKEAKNKCLTLIFSEEMSDIVALKFFQKVRDIRSNTIQFIGVVNSVKEQK